jgi:hypothetical protein
LQINIFINFAALYSDRLLIHFVIVCILCPGKSHCEVLWVVVNIRCFDDENGVICSPPHPHPFRHCSLDETLGQKPAFAHPLLTVNHQYCPFKNLHMFETT